VGHDLQLGRKGWHVRMPLRAGPTQKNSKKKRVGLLRPSDRIQGWVAETLFLKDDFAFELVLHHVLKETYKYIHPRLSTSQVT
jgi:hypothetical protein